MSNEEILKNVEATMAMENMFLQQDEKETIMNCLNGNKSFSVEIEKLIKEFCEKKTD